MAAMNDTMKDLEKIGITEFELDTEERNAILEETNNILQKVGRESKLTISFSSETCGNST